MRRVWWVRRRLGCRGDMHGDDTATRRCVWCDGRDEAQDVLTISIETEPGSSTVAQTTGKRQQQVRSKLVGHVGHVGHRRPPVLYDSPITQQHTNDIVHRSVVLLIFKLPYSLSHLLAIAARASSAEAHYFERAHGRAPRRGRAYFSLTPTSLTLTPYEKNST